ncbi:MULTISPECIES: hypothetical protein [Xanthomonas]|nr:hypothetical protein [Xanthomonas axonopodis]
MDITGATDILTMPPEVASVASCVLAPICVPVLLVVAVVPVRIARAVA